LKKASRCYRAGEPFGGLFAVRFGLAQETVLAEDGRRAGRGLPMLGDIIGLDGIGTDATAARRGPRDTEVA